MRDEFADLHLRDERLDEDIKSTESIQQSRLATADAFPILPQIIEEVAERLVVLANQIEAP